ncbi:hypothetical protein [Natronorubrum daqingense]|uniref:Superfamily I DNA or RNA helicase n=1 Tax=Natronorubrum daqingense TaxID=588898 RepID=A0A1N7CQ25_9EURY|nr:hypothetical protein [Natronorubrum daqingense]APX97003.1 hypothetical protein BB347_10435 [Natronorubrum daqingense]SIR65617.1 hypothetical protein SAMN05421809_1818 [Natronorubrum daqingense]
MASQEPTLQGTCTLLAEPCSSDALFDHIATEYAALADEYEPQNVLVLKRHPAGLENLTEALAAASTADDTPKSPRVESLPEHASKVLEEHDPTLDRLEYEERIELISLVIDGASRDVPAYLERASDHESFARDVGQLLLEATRQQLGLTDVEAEEPRESLAFLYAMNDRFHAVLEEREYVERADVVPQTVDLLEGDVGGLRTRVTDSIDAVLAVEFEEYRRLDRRYLAALSEDTALVCLGERHASVERTRVEPGCIEDHVGDGLTVEILDPRRDCRETTPASRSPQQAVSRFLATGACPQDSADDSPQHSAGADPGHSAGDGSRSDGRKLESNVADGVFRIRTQTAAEQVSTVASEIQALRDRHGWGFEEFAVAVPRIERVPETRRRLREAGIPTATIGTPSLAEDPVVHELYAFVTLQGERERRSDRVDAELATEDARERASSDQRARGPIDPRDPTTEPSDVALERLRARVDGLSLETVESCSHSRVSRSLERWIRRTDLKGRIAREEKWVDAREQFASLRRVLEIARFVEETDLVGPDWQGLRRMLRRTIQYDAPYVHAVDAQPPTGGVTVCAIDDLKYDTREAVFVLDLIDDAYPGEQFLTQLFPTAWVREMPTYPAVTDPSVEDVTATFASADPDGIGDPFEAYHAQRSRRRLALGARAARSALYCCSFERGAGGLDRTHDVSRYLQLLESARGSDLPTVEPETTAAIHGEQNALEAVLAQPHGELERIVREASTGGDADLATTEELFEEIALVLAHDEIDDELADAVRSQFEFAAGEVIRNE